jgi:hypothetical protein
MRTCCTTIVLLLALLSPLAIGPAAAQTANVAPTLIPVSGQLRTAEGQPRTGNVLLVISLYEGQADTAPRWIEHQQVTLDAAGRYELNFGATRTDGLPSDLFGAEAPTKWLGVAVENEAEQPRVMLVSVPYAAKAASADTLAGRAATDFVLSSTFRDDVRAVIEDADPGSDGSVGANAVALNYLAKSDGAGDFVDSAIFDNAGSLGIGTTTPGAALQIGAGTGPGFGTAASRKLFLVNNGQTDLFLRDANAGIVFRLTAGPAAFNSLIGTASNHPFDIVTNNQTRMAFDTTGRVGIGTSAPTTKLHVVGDAFINGGLGVGVAPTDDLQVKSSANGFGFTMRNVAGTQNIAGFRSATSGTVGSFFLRNASNLDTVFLHGAGDSFFNAGNVGIGTSTPTAKLHVVGGATITGNLVVDGNIAAKYQDVAEWVDAVEPVEAGSLVIIDPDSNNRVRASDAAYDSRVGGAVSPQPGLVLGEGGPGRVLVAQSGRVRIKADASYGAIRPGDLLVTSPRKGHAMRSTPLVIDGHDVHRPGTLIGKALEPLAAGQGEVLVLLTLQ